MALRGAKGLLAAAVLATLACWPAPGHGEKAARGFRRAVPVIAALAEYKRAHGAYPDSLSQLVPTYLADSALAVPLRVPEPYPFEYRDDSSGYELVFRYVGPGMNHCEYRSVTRKWSCGGYF